MDEKIVVIGGKLYVCTIYPVHLGYNDISFPQSQIVIKPSYHFIPRGLLSVQGIVNQCHGNESNRYNQGARLDCTYP